MLVMPVMTDAEAQLPVILHLYYMRSQFQTHSCPGNLPEWLALNPKTLSGLKYKDGNKIK